MSSRSESEDAAVGVGDSGASPTQDGSLPGDGGHDGATPIDAATDSGPGPGRGVVAPEVEGHGLPEAPSFGQPIRYLPTPGAVTVYLPEAAGAADYRVFALSPGVDVSIASDGAERVEGAVIACAGLVQHNQCDDEEAISSYGPNIRVAKCSADARAVSLPKRVLRQVGLDGLSGKTTIVVEAIDALCPFPGVYGSTHHEVDCEYDGQRMATATYEGKAVTWPLGPAAFPVRTEQEIRADYGSLILNGQAPPPTVEGESPWASIGLPSPSRDPVVLRRAVVEVEPLDPTSLPDGFDSDDFYESFSDPNDQPKRVNDSEIVSAIIPVQNPTLFQTSKLNLYSFAADGPQFFVAQGVLRSVLADVSQAIMGSNLVYPKRAFPLPSSDETYLHATFEIPTGASQRRYWWFHACGAENAGETIVNGKLAPRSAIIPTPGFMNPIEGTSVSTKGWNCLQVVPRGGSYEIVPGGPYTDNRLGGGRAETDLRIVINRAVANPSSLQDLSGTVVNVSPAQMRGDDPELDGAWMREWDANKKIVGPLLDDEMYVDQRVKFDIYFNRGRIVLYANGVQKLCNDFPNERLTMAESAIGIGHVFYHSSVERMDFMREDWLRTGQYQYLHNLPFADPRSIDNFGVREGAALPSDFQAGQCYSAE